MGNTWKEKLANFFEELMIISGSRKEAIETFDNFCDVVAEPAFEAMAEELKKYKIKSKIKKANGKSMAFQINFSKSNIDNFQYVILLDRKSIEFNLILKIMGRKTKKNRAEEREEDFLPEIELPSLLELEKEVLIQDIIEHYRNFRFQALTELE